MNELYQKAMVFAVKAHAGQVRKYTFEPYVWHPIHVSEIVAKYFPENMEMQAAALLHDTIEDCGVSEETLLQEFGPQVTRLVVELSNVSRPEHGNRKVRKAMDRDALAAASAEAQSIKVADLLSNTPSIVKYDPKFAKVYLTEKSELLEVLTKAHPSLLAEARAVLAMAQEQEEQPVAD